MLTDIIKAPYIGVELIQKMYSFPKKMTYPMKILYILKDKGITHMWYFTTSF